MARTALVSALAPVVLRVEADLGTRTSRTGDTFPISLARPIVVDGVELVKAGAPGEGEVIWAKKPGMSGSGGELVLAARWIAVGERRVKLRSMRFAAVGQDRIGPVNSLAVASAASPLPVSVIGFFVSGRHVLIPCGTLAEAKLAESLELGATMGADGVRPGVAP